MRKTQQTISLLLGLLKAVTLLGCLPLLKQLNVRLLQDKIT